MKKRSLFSLVVWLAVILFVQASGAEDYTRWNLPDGPSRAWAKEALPAETERWPGPRTARG